MAVYGTAGPATVQPDFDIVDKTAAKKWGICGGFVAAKFYYPPRNLIQRTETIRSAGTSANVNFDPSGCQFGRAAQWFDDSGTRNLYYLTGQPAANNFTFICRIRVNQLPTAPGVIMRTDSSSSGGGSGNTIPLWMNSGFDARVDGSDVSSGGTWNLGQWYDIAIISNSSGFTIYANNQAQTSGAAVSSTAIEQYLVIGNPAGGGGLSAGDFEIMHCLFANRAWSINELRAFSANPWQLFDDPFSSFFYTGAGGGSSGTVAVTLADATLAASGTSTIVGSVAQTLANVTAAAAGTTTILGALTETLDDTTLAASGSVGSPVTGDVAETLEDTTLSASGTTTIVGTVAVTLADTTLSAAGTTTILGSVGTTLGNDTLAASGSVGGAVSGSVSETLDDATLAASGTTTVLGTVSYTTENMTLAAAGTTQILGTLSVTLGNATLVATGTSGVTAAGAEWRFLKLWISKLGF